MNDDASLTLRMGTRGSLLARMQSQMIADALKKQHRGLSVELVICKTSGDVIQDRPLHDLGGKGLFTKELEEALLSESIDFAVHSLKDVPVTMPLIEQDALTIAAVPPRGDVRDLLICKSVSSLLDLPIDARVGTSSLRRRCQLLALRPDLRIEMIRGNIDSRVRKLREGQYDAIVLAMAGMMRSGLFDQTIMSPIPLDLMLPAAGQGALAIQCRRADETTKELLEVLDDPITHECVSLERSIVQALDGDCHSPIAALASTEGKTVQLRAAVGARGGDPPIIKARATADLPESKQALAEVLMLLDQHRARQLLGTDKQQH